MARRRLTAAQRGYGAAWRKVRTAVLERDGHACQLRLPGCTAGATTVDHILERDRGGTNDPGNLRASCVPCNATRGAQYGNAKRATARTRPHPFFEAERQDPAAVSVLSPAPHNERLSSQELAP